MIICYERNKIFDYVGSDASKTSFNQAFPKMAKFDKGHTIFYTSGIFQLKEGPCLLVLPWFFKNFENELRKSDMTNFLDVLKDVIEYRDNFIKLKNDSAATAQDVILLSNLIKTLELVKNLTSKNHHIDETDLISSIKGKWHLEKDLSSSIRPIKFTCSYGNLNINTPLLQLIKAYAFNIRDLVKTQKNILYVNEILNLLSGVDTCNLNIALVIEAKKWALSLNDFREIEGVLNFIELFCIKKEIYAEEAGVALTFRLDKFFEKLVESFFRPIPNSFVTTQQREELLGGGIWSENGSEAVSLVEVKDSIKTIPDIVVDYQENLLVFECKYKPLRVPFINEGSKEEFLIAFDRSDRNQILSFILSLRPGANIAKKNVFFSVVFPCSTIDSFKVSTLSFESAKLHIDPIVRSLIQNKAHFNFDGCLKIRFIGINVLHALNSIKQNDEIGLKVINDITGNLNVVRIDQAKGESKNKINRRLALASMIVKKNENELGKVKLAKIIFMADAHLKLDLGTDYVREAAGPLDYATMYNLNVGVESLAEKNALFYKTKIRKESFDIEKTKYSPGVNLENYLKTFHLIFPDKAINISKMIDDLVGFNFKEVETVATVYACWNDLLFEGKKVSEELIVNEFLTNWHEEKTRKFDSNDGRKEICDAILWLKENEILPDGKVRLTRKILNNKIVNN